MGATNKQRSKDSQRNKPIDARATVSAIEYATGKAQANWGLILAIPTEEITKERIAWISPNTLIHQYETIDDKKGNVLVKFCIGIFFYGSISHYARCRCGWSQIEPTHYDVLVKLDEHLLSCKEARCQ